jgi:hypothetical protein
LCRGSLPDFEKRLSFGLIPAAPGTSAEKSIIPDLVNWDVSPSPGARVRPQFFPGLIKGPLRPITSLSRIGPVLLR